MKSALVLIALVGAALWIWRDAMRARESAMAIARRACARRSLQLLDDTVALVRIAPTRAMDGRLALRRVYAFECSGDGMTRLGGVVVLAGASVETVHVPEPDGSDGAASRAT